ncbi:CBS domain-containing protein [Terasakiella sp. A23]|uniref:CBS domain-containing protein n=1 Tax=Terasakiella sp. FCG-A23 TaxID=3080561 RepID=UPI002953A616|nr:CBS domain-containing protein [Terasakiella sp. A23]MDV7341385.1 CBS domain-containing protein [Terasakiella sp. A23]
MQKRLVPDVIKECRCTTFSPDQTARDAAILMTNENIGALVIVEGDAVVGIVTERDIMRKLVGARVDPDAVKVSDIMTPNPDTVTGECLAGQALNMMVTKGYRHLPILTDDGKPCGMVSVRDLYQAVQDSLQEDLEAVENYVHGGDGYGVGT